MQEGACWLLLRDDGEREGAGQGRRFETERRARNIILYDWQWLWY